MDNANNWTAAYGLPPTRPAYPSGTVIPGWCPPPAPACAECGTVNTRYAIDEGGGEIMIGWECPNDSCLRDGEELPEIRWPFEDTGRFSQLEELGFRPR